MAGLLLLAAAFGWFAVCLAFAIFLSKRISSVWGEIIFVVFMTIALFVAPFANQIFGKLEFDNYCKSAENVSILGVIPAPQELYSSVGAWRLATYSPAQSDEHTRLVQLADSLVRWETGNYLEISSFAHVGKRQTKIYERSSNRLVAEWTSYSFRGGLSGLMGSTTECHPKLLRESGYGLYKQLFQYKNQK